MQTHTFSGIQSLLSVANDPTLQADEKPVFTRDENTALDADPGDMDGIGRNPDTDPEDEPGYAIEAMQGHKALFNPESGRLFDVVTDSYTITNPPQFIGPLCESLKERDRGDIEGTIRTYDGGARVYGELLFRETHSIHLPGRGRSNPVRCGFNFRWSHDSGLSVRASGFAQDTACKNSMRQITSGINVKHSGDVHERVDWKDEWESVLDELGAFSELLAGVIEDAMGVTLFDFRDFPEASRWIEQTEPLDLIENVETPGPITDEARDAAYGFFELIGFPSYLGVAATERLFHRLASNDDPRTATAWDVYSAATYALTHDFRGDPGKSDDDKHRMAKEILLNPRKTVEDADREARSRATPDREGVESGVEPDVSTEDTVGEALRSDQAAALRTTFE